MELVALAESVKPEDGPNDEHNYGVRNEDPIENNETDGDVIPLNNRPDGYEASKQQTNAHDKPS